MKSASATLSAVLLNYSEHIFADLVSIYFPTGTQYLTTATSNITIGGTTWTAAHIGVPSLSQGLGTEVETYDVEVGTAGRTVSGMGYGAASLAGAFNGVRVLIQRARTRTNFSGYLAADLESIFDGTCTKAVPRRDSVVVMTVQSKLALGNSAASKRRVSGDCPFSLGDSNCGVTLATFQDATKNVASGSTAAVVNLNSSSTKAVTGSVLTVTSGAWSGRSRVIRSVSGVACTLDVPLPGIEVGASLTITRACDRKIATCVSVFSNAARCGACPNAPSDLKET